MSIRPMGPSQAGLAGAYVTVVEHGATAGTARPAGATRVFWRGTVAPTNAVQYDRWVNTTSSPYIESIYNGATWDVVGSATFATKADAAFTGTVALPGGASSLRRPVNGSVVIDGSVAKTLPGDKVAYSFAATIKGGFTGDSGGNPTFAWGANDFIVTGTTAGDVAGVTNLCARETELHLYTPAAAVTTMKGLQVDCKVEAAAVGATVTTMFGIYVAPVSAAAGTVTTAYGLYIDAPTAGATNEALHVVGTTSLVGPTTLNGAITLTGAVSQASGSVKFTGLMASNAQAAPAGVYVGNNGSFYGVNIADGTNAAGFDLNGTLLRIMKAGVAVVATFDLSNNVFSPGGTIQMAEGKNLAIGTATGTKIGTGTTQKLAFYGTNPIVQPSGTPAAATDAATTQALVNDLRTKLLALGLVA